MQDKAAAFPNHFIRHTPHMIATRHFATVYIFLLIPQKTKISYPKAKTSSAFVFCRCKKSGGCPIGRDI
ncbi:MAG: hypothetical protein IKH16_04460, partial [Selenomonadaceae bacterium]|nr:hypothetical protein [Selenomonadaceae bacterium]